MTYIPKPNTGSIRPNEYKKVDSHPDYKGSIVVDKQLLLDQIAKGENPVKFDLAGWKNVGANGQRYLSIKISEPFVKEAPKQQPIPQEDDEDAPF